MEVGGLVLTVVALLPAFKGAVDSFLYLKDICVQDKDVPGVDARAKHAEDLKQKFEEWIEDFSVKDELKDNSPLRFLDASQQKDVKERLNLIRENLDTVKRLIGEHPKKKSNFRFFRSQPDAEERNKKWAKWITTNKDKTDKNLDSIETAIEGLVVITKAVAPLKSKEWGNAIHKFTTVDENYYHNEFVRRRQDGTCKWIFSRTEYKDWISKTDSNLLWINATAGSGKTVLTSALIEELRKSTSNQKSKSCLAYFYCKFDEPDTLKLVNLFGSLVAQLSRQNLDIRYKMFKYLASFQNAHDQVKSTSVQYERLVEIIVECVNTFDQAYLLIDALDEFIDPTESKQAFTSRALKRDPLFESLKLLQEKGDGKIKILFTSRPSADIEAGLEGSKMITLTMSETSNLEDIELFLNAQLEKKISRNCLWREKLATLVNVADLRKEMQTAVNYSKRLTELVDLAPADLTWKQVIVTFLAERACGMFLWAELQRSFLFDKRNPPESILNTLASLPRSLERTYEKILQRLEELSENQEHEKIVRILQWLVAAARPLSLEEINTAVLLGEDEPANQTNALPKDPKEFVRLCGPLVRLISQGNPDEPEQVSLAHFSLKEYLVSGTVLTSDSSKIHKYNVKLCDAHSYVAKVSLNYISFKEPGEAFAKGKDLDAIRKHYKLLDYAVLYGGTHLRPLQKADDDLIALLNAIFHPEVVFQPRSNTQRITPTVQSHLFLELFSILSDWRAWRSKEHPPDIDPLYYASLYGWKAGVKRILENQEQRKEYVLNHALRAASLAGYVDIIVLLHQAGADVNAHLGFKLGSPIQSAAYAGREEAVKKLLDLGANPDCGRPFYRTGGTVGSALQGAAVSNNENIVRLLIEHGADVNSNTGWLGTPLQAVLEAGRPKMAKFLMATKEFKPNITGGYYGSAPRFCCFEGSTSNHVTYEILKELLDKGSSPSERVGPYGSLLEIACHFGHKEKVELLLRRGAVPGSSAVGTFGNAIHAAAMSGREDIVDSLICNGACVDCPGGWIGREIRANGRTTGMPIVRLQQGQGFLAFDHSRITEAFFAPMLHASLKVREVDHNKIFFVFEDEITHREGHFGNALQGAAFRGHCKVIEKLIEKGAEVNQTGGFFGTALQAAASQGHLEAVRTLLKLGAEPNVVSEGHYGTALAAATALKFEGVVAHLLSRGAKLETVDDHGWNIETWNTLVDWNAPSISSDNVAQCKLPSEWGLRYRSSQLLVHNDGTVKLPRSVRRHEGKDLGATVLANHPIPPHKNFYFEVKIVNRGDPTGTIAIGLSERDIPTFKLPGEAEPNWGFRGDDGGCFAHKNPDPKKLVWPHGASYGYRSGTSTSEEQVREALMLKGLDTTWPLFATGDVVGCGVEWDTTKCGKGNIFWTHNGVKLEPGVEFQGRRLYPAVGLRAKGAVVQANFGRDGFNTKSPKYVTTLIGFGLFCLLLILAGNFEILWENIRKIVDGTRFD